MYFFLGVSIRKQAREDTRFLRVLMDLILEMGGKTVYISVVDETAFFSTLGWVPACQVQSNSRDDVAMHSHAETEQFSKQITASSFMLGNYSQILSRVLLQWKIFQKLN